MLFKPSLGEATELRYDGHRHLIGAMAAGFAVGFYDGALGPGTGSFLVIGLVGLLGYSFLEASAKAKMANVADQPRRPGRLHPAGRGAVENRPGDGRLQPDRRLPRARTAVAKGAGFVRVFFIVVVAGFIIRLGGSVLGIW